METKKPDETSPLIGTPGGTPVEKKEIGHSPEGREVKPSSQWSPRSLYQQAKAKGSKLFERKSTKSEETEPKEKKSLTEKFIRPLKESTSTYFGKQKEEFKANVGEMKKGLKKFKDATLEKSISEQAGSIKTAVGKYLKTRKEEFKENVDEMKKGLQVIKKEGSEVLEKARGKISVEKTEKTEVDKPLNITEIGHISDFTTIAHEIFSDTWEDNNVKENPESTFKGVFRSSPNITEQKELADKIQKGGWSLLTQTEQDRLSNDLILLGGVIKNLHRRIWDNVDPKIQESSEFKERKVQSQKALLGIGQIIIQAQKIAVEKEREKRVEEIIKDVDPKVIQEKKGPFSEILAPEALVTAFPTLTKAFARDKEKAEDVKSDLVVQLTLTPETSDQFIRRMNGDLLRPDTFETDFAELIDRYKKGDIPIDYIHGALKSTNINIDLPKLLRKEGVIDAIDSLGKEKKVEFLKNLLSLDFEESIPSTILRSNFLPGLLLYTDLMKDEIKVKAEQNEELQSLMGTSSQKVRSPQQDPRLEGEAQRKERTELLKSNGALIAPFITKLAETLKDASVKDSVTSQLTRHFLTETQKFNEENNLQRDPKQFLAMILSNRSIATLFGDEGQRRYAEKEKELGITEKKAEVTELQNKLAKIPQENKSERDALQVEIDLRKKEILEDYDKVLEVSATYNKLASALQYAVDNMDKDDMVSPELVEALNDLKDVFKA